MHLVRLNPMTANGLGRPPVQRPALKRQAAVQQRQVTQAQRQLTAALKRPNQTVALQNREVGLQARVSALQSGATIRQANAAAKAVQAATRTGTKPSKGKPSPASSSAQAAKLKSIKAAMACAMPQLPGTVRLPKAQRQQKIVSILTACGLTDQAAQVRSMKIGMSGLYGYGMAGRRNNTKPTYRRGTGGLGGLISGLFGLLGLGATDYSTYQINQNTGYPIDPQTLQDITVDPTTNIPITPQSTGGVVSGTGGAFPPLNPISLPQPVATPAPKGCKPGSSKPACIFFQMEQQDQQNFNAIFQVIIQMEQQMMGLIQQLLTQGIPNQGGGPPVGQPGGVLIDPGTGLPIGSTGGFPSGPQYYDPNASAAAGAGYPLQTYSPGFDASSVDSSISDPNAMYAQPGAVAQGAYPPMPYAPGGFDTSVPGIDVPGYGDGTQYVDYTGGGDVDAATGLPSDMVPAYPYGGYGPYAQTSGDVSMLPDSSDNGGGGDMFSFGGGDTSNIQDISPYSMYSQPMAPMQPYAPSVDMSAMQTAAGPASNMVPMQAPQLPATQMPSAMRSPQAMLPAPIATQSFDSGGLATQDQAQILADALSNAQITSDEGY